MKIISYKKNLRRLLSYYPYIYLNENTNVDNNIKKYALHHVINNGYGVFGQCSFICFNNGIVKVLAIGVSLDELTNIINQKIRDEKLKQVIEIINGK